MSLTPFSWHWDPTVLLGLSVSAVGYALLAWRLWRTAGRFDRRAAAAWILGLLIILVALESPLDGIAEEKLLSAHMLQHGLLMSVAPPLLLLGMYPRLIVPFSRPIIKPLLLNPRAHSALRVLSAPAIALGLWLAALYVWHLPVVYQAALQHDNLHIVEHLFFVNAGLLFWAPIIEPVPALVRMKPLAKLGYLAAAEAGMAMLVALFLWGPQLYPFYDGASLWDISWSLDQRLAGLVMVVVDMLVVLTAASWISFRALADIERRHRRLAPTTK